MDILSKMKGFVLFFFFKELVSLLPLSTNENKTFVSYLAKVAPIIYLFFPGLPFNQDSLLEHCQETLTYL